MTTTTTSLILPTHQNTTRQATIQILNVTSEIMDLDRDLKIERLELTRLLMKPCCTGTAHWRQETLYANHGIGQTCPMHGDPGQGKRLRIYVSNKSRKQQPVLEAMARQAKASQVAIKYKQLFDRLDTIKQLLEKIWS